MLEIEQIQDLLEVDTMLAERIESWFDEATRKGVEQGMQQGMQRGQLVGQAVFLSKLLNRRFGELPPTLVDRLNQATQDELDAWGAAVLSADSLDDVFQARN